jgi:hypothetical protein
MAYCRKIYASWLRQSGIESEIVDLLQGSVTKTVFARHYLLQVWIIGIVMAFVWFLFFSMIGTMYMLHPRLLLLYKERNYISVGLQRPTTASYSPLSPLSVPACL